MRRFARRLILDAPLVFAPLPSPPPPQSLDVQYYLSNAAANNTSSSDPPPFASPDEATTQFSPSMAAILVILLGAFFFMGFFSVYVRNCTRDDDDLGTNNPRRLGSRRRAARPAQGLDSALVDSLPMVTYSIVKEGKESTECVVCLCEFEENESLRLLPQCKHCFHKECIDMWLFSHTTCPLCRRSLQPQRAGSNRGGDISAGELTPAREADAVEASSSAPGVEVALSIRDIGMQDSVRNGSGEDGRVSDAGSAQYRDYARFGDTQGPATQVETSVRYGSPIFGATEPSPSGGLKSKGRIPRGLRRSHSTGHSLVKRALNRANRILPASSDEIDETLSSHERTVSELHRSKSYTMLSDQRSREKEESQWEDDSETRVLDPSRGKDNLKGWRSFSFRRAFSLKRSSQEARGGLFPFATSTVGEASADAGTSSSVRRTFDRLAT